MTAAQSAALEKCRQAGSEFCTPDGGRLATMRVLERLGFVTQVRTDTWNHKPRGRFGRHAVKTSRLCCAAVWKMNNRKAE